MDGESLGECGREEFSGVWHPESIRDIRVDCRGGGCTERRKSQVLKVVFALLAMASMGSEPAQDTALGMSYVFSPTGLGAEKRGAVVWAGKGCLLWQGM